MHALQGVHITVCYAYGCVWVCDFVTKIFTLNLLALLKKILLQMNSICLVITLGKTKMHHDTCSLSYTHLSGKVAYGLYSALFIAKKDLWWVHYEIKNYL